MPCCCLPRPDGEFDPALYAKTVGRSVRQVGKVGIRYGEKSLVSLGSALPGSLRENLRMKLKGKASLRPTSS
jgi:hypothetical protein